MCIRDRKKVDFKLYKGDGCKHCRGTGYKGRIGVFETLLVTGSIREAIIQKATNTEIEKIAIKEGMSTLRDSALSKLHEGVTTLEEVIRETKVE
jgi:type II secretory ATPase GspE/PulE/Tfp pilus assembly ATPase PilB-like protein